MIRGHVDPRFSLDTMEERNIAHLPGIETIPLARSLVDILLVL
jgi:hypothetical protein